MDIAESFEKVLPVFLIILLGFSMRYSGVLSNKDGSALLKLVYYVGAPALILTSFANTTLEASTIAISLIVPAVVGITLLVIYALKGTALKAVEPKTLGALIVGAVVMNTGFLIPVVSQLYGPEGVVRIVMIDAINGIFVFSIVHAIAIRAGNGAATLGFIVNKVLLSPPVWALALALALKGFDASLPENALSILAVPAKITPPIILLALGLELSFRIVRPGLLATGLALRFLLGGLIGMGVVWALGLEGLNATIVLLASMAPAGFMSIIFSDLENLNTAFAAAFVSISLVIITLALPFLLTVV